ncbi:MAG: ABC transporter substrate-binding protein [Betaproteobacteria bacterium]
MRRRALLAVAGALLLPSLPAAQPAKTRRIAVLDDADRSAMADRWRELSRRLQELGHADGTSVAFDVRSSEGGGERLQALAAELAATRPDVIVAGNSVMSTDAAGKRLELLRELIPNATRFGYLGKMSNPGVMAAYEQTMGAARSLRVTILKFDAADDATIGFAFDAMARERVQGLVVSPVLETHRRQIAGLAARHRLPVIYGSGEFLDAGGLLTYGTERAVLERRAAEYVHRILQGAKPANLPVEQVKFALGVNLKAAKALGVTIPQSVLLRADRVVE